VPNEKFRVNVHVITNAQKTAGENAFSVNLAFIDWSTVGTASLVESVKIQPAFHESDERGERSPPFPF
jgi:hypothetical protein